MTLFFQISFVIATVAIVAVAFRLAWQAYRSETAGRPAVRGSEALAAGALFGGSMLVTALAAGHWHSVDGADLTLFATVFGITTAALIERARPRTAAFRAVYVLPVVFGVVAGLTVDGL